MANEKELSVEVLSSDKYVYDLDQVIFDIDDQIDLLTSKADKLDYLVSIASGLLCSALDILWVGDFDLMRGRDFASDKVEGFVEKTAKKFGCKDGDLQDYVSFLEEKFPLASDANMNDFGGALQHHLRDFAHHPTIVGLIFSLLTQFTGNVYGTDKQGIFRIYPLENKEFIGKDVPTKLLYGTVYWFFHLVSDIAGSSGTVMTSGGTGIPGPILSLAKEIAALPLFKPDNEFSLYISKAFNGTLLADHDENGRLIKESILRLDFRGELGAFAEVGRQAIPVAANECIVRLFYFIRHFATEIKEKKIKKISDLKKIDWKNVVPSKSPTLTRMLTVATGIFTAVDITDAVVSQKYWVSINYVGVGRFAVAIGGEMAWALKRNDLEKIKKMYETIKLNAFEAEDNKLYGLLQENYSKGETDLTLDQIEILYNIEYYLIKHDIESTECHKKTDSIKALKQEWLDEWTVYMTNGYAELLKDPNAKLDWYTLEQLRNRIKELNPKKTWYKIALLEALLLEPYFPLSCKLDKKGKQVVDKKYSKLSGPKNGYDKKQADKFLEGEFAQQYCSSGFIAKLRKSNEKVMLELDKSLMASWLIAHLVAVCGLTPIGIPLTLITFGLSSAAIVTYCPRDAKSIMKDKLARQMIAIQAIYLDEERDFEQAKVSFERILKNITELRQHVDELEGKKYLKTKDELKEVKEQIKDENEIIDEMKKTVEWIHKRLKDYNKEYKVELAY